jgi:hypothetical protein
MTDLKEIRLFFEPKLGTNVNHSQMFNHYASHWLDGFDAEWGGSISMDAGQKVLKIFEPVYQFILRNPSVACKLYLEEYISRNTLIGYYVHMYTRELNKNFQHYKVFGNEAD